MKLTVFSILLLLVGQAMGQVVKGKVFDAKTHETIPGASVYWLGSRGGTATTGEGTFTLELNQTTNQLVVSFVGYANDTIEVKAGATIEVKLMPSATTLKAVEIKGRQKSKIQKFGSVEQTEVISAEGLRGLACCNLGESFENSVSVDVGYSDAVSGSKQIQLLGLTGIYSQMLLENTPFLRGLSAPFGLGYVPGQWMEGISVSKGVATVKNGYEAITGTINIDYEKPHKGDLLSLNLYGNTDLKSEITAKYNYQFNDKFSTGVYAFGTYNNHRMDMLGHDGFMDVPLQQQLNVLNRWHYENPGGLCSQTVINYTHEQRLGGEMDFEKSMKGCDTIYGFGGTTDRLHFFTKNGFPLNSYSSFGSQVTATYFNQDAFYGLSQYHGRETDLYVNLLVNAEVRGGHILDYGASMRYSNSVENLYSMPYVGAVLSQPELLMTEVVPGAFGQYTFKYGDRFTATGGLRYDYNSGYERHLVTPRLHFRWKLAEKFILRGSGGKGYRSTNVIAENFGLLATSRNISITEPLKMEEAWNAGLNLMKTFVLGEDKEISLTIDYYHTNFVNQVVIDLDRDVNMAYISNLQGESYSNVVQADLNINIVEGFEVSLAGKINDVKCTYNGQLMPKPYTAKWKGLLVLSYHTRFDKWRFDLTTQLNGPQRLPLNCGTLQGEAPAYVYMLGQVARKFKRWEVYLGCENITNYVQDIPVIGADAPFSQAFDASIVYAPLMGRLIYMGLRINIK